MNLQRWIARRETSWKQLDALLKQVEKRGLKSLQASEIQKLASLYRSVSADFGRVPRTPGVLGSSDGTKNFASVKPAAAIRKFTKDRDGKNGRQFGSLCCGAFRRQ